MSCPHVTRRQFVAGTAALAIGASLSGCLGSDEEVPSPEPVDLSGGEACDVCGMVIADHYGPGAQIFYEDDHPADRDGPAWFDSVREMLNYDQERRARGREPIGSFVTDYSAVDYELIEEDGNQFISSHVAAGDFVSAVDATFIVGGPIHGAMGPDHFPFSDRDEAEDFAGSEGGEVVGWDELRLSSSSTAG